MKSRLLLTQLLILVLFSGLFLVSCEEHSQNGTDEQQQTDASKVSSESDGEADFLFDRLFDDAMGVNADVGLGTTGIFGRTLSCPTITVTHLNPNTQQYFPARVVIDFGPTPCSGPIPDGHLRRGKMIIEYTNRLIYPDAMAVTTFDNFYFDSIKVEGTHKIKNTSLTGTNQPPNRQYTIDVIDGKLTRPNGDYTMWSGHHIMNQVEGIATLTHQDDVFKITGQATGRVRRNNLIALWESTIIEPLVKRFTCDWIMKGTIRTVRTGTSVNGPWVALLDFGNGLACDRLATITINGRIHQITLP
jgi:hypothetical protein